MCCRLFPLPPSPETGVCMCICAFYNVAVWISCQHTIWSFSEICGSQVLNPYRPWPHPIILALPQMLRTQSFFPAWNKRFWFDHKCGIPPHAPLFVTKPNAFATLACVSQTFCGPSCKLWWVAGRAVGGGGDCTCILRFLPTPHADTHTSANCCAAVYNISNKSLTEINTSQNAPIIQGL